MSTMGKKIKVGLHFLRRQKWAIKEETILLIYRQYKNIINVVFSCLGTHLISIGLQSS